MQDGTLCSFVSFHYLAVIGNEDSNIQMRRSSFYLFFVGKYRIIP